MYYRNEEKVFGWPFCSYQFPHVDAVMHAHILKSAPAPAPPVVRISPLLRLPMFPILKLISPEPHGSLRGPEEEPMVGFFSYWFNISQCCVLQLSTSSLECLECLECDGYYFRSANEITRICLLAYAFTHGHYLVNYDKLNKVPLVLFLLLL